MRDWEMMRFDVNKKTTRRKAVVVGVGFEFRCRRESGDQTDDLISSR